MMGLACVLLTSGSVSKPPRSLTIGRRSQAEGSDGLLHQLPLVDDDDPRSGPCCDTAGPGGRTPGRVEDWAGCVF